MTFLGGRAGILALTIVVGLSSSAWSQAFDADVAGPNASQPAEPAEAAPNAGQPQGTALPPSTDDEETSEQSLPSADPDSAAQLEGESLSTMNSSSAAGDPPAELKSSLAKVAIPSADGSTGSLRYDVDIDVPAFRGLEPRIGLNYNSSRKTRLGGVYQGWLGYGWGMDGFDVIERASPGFGIPEFEASDVYLLNGMELVPCAQASTTAPSCATGGTHVTLNESYRRISFANNQWTVTDRDGTVSTFKTVATVAGVSPPANTPEYDLGQRARWLLTSVADTYGNTVAYNYACPDMSASPRIAVCYPDTVAYNKTVITFYRATRPDVIMMANGHDIAETKQRIRTIGIKVDGVQRSSYSLTYDQAPFSNASRLTQVDLFGTNAAVSATGAITPPTTGLPGKRIAAFTYQDTTAAYTAYMTPAAMGIPPSDNNANPSLLQASDLDFDGRDEVSAIYSNVVTTGGQNGSSNRHRGLTVWSFDMNGQNPASNSVALETLSVDATYIENLRFGRFLANRLVKDFAYSFTWFGSTGGQNPRPVPVTFNGIIKNDDPLATYGCSSSATTGYPCSGVGTLSFVADMDGDGVDGLYYFGSPQPPAGVADVLGNGRTHALVISGGNGAVYKARLDGSTWQFDPIGSLNRSFATEDASGFDIADVNGDGASDIILRGPNAPTNGGIYLSTGKGFKALPLSLSFGGVLSDYDNDGKADAISSNYSTSRAYSLRTGTTGNTTVEFTPFPLPAVVALAGC